MPPKQVKAGKPPLCSVTMGGRGCGGGGDVTENVALGSGATCLIICVFVFVAIPLLVAGVVMVTVLGLRDYDVYVAGIVLAAVGGVLVLGLFILILLVCCGCIGTKRSAKKRAVTPQPEKQRPKTPYEGPTVLWDGAYGTETLGFRAEKKDDVGRIY